MNAKDRETIQDALNSAVTNLMAIDTARNALQLDLARAKAEFEKPPSETEIDQWRLGCLLQLRAVRAFLEGQGIPDDLMRPLQELMASLADLERGAANEHLKPRSRGAGRSPAPVMEAITYGRAAAALTMLMEAGRTEEAAAQEVAQRLRGIAPFGQNSIGGDAEGLMRYRDRIKSEEARKAAKTAGQKPTLFHAAEVYARALKALPVRPPAEVAEFILSNMTGEPTAETF